MKVPRERTVIRWLHLLLSIPIVGYLYGPVASIPPAARFTRWIAAPVVVLSGLWLWLKPRIMQRLHQRHVRPGHSGGAYSVSTPKRPRVSLYTNRGDQANL